MSTVNINFKMDAETKREFERLCRQLGMPMSTAFNLFAKKMVRDQALPFDLNLESPRDPFYSPENLEHLRKLNEELMSGKAVIEQHELLES